MRKFLFLSVLLATVFASIATAADAPLLSASRFSLAVGANSLWYTNVEEPIVLAKSQEFTVGVYAAYNLTPHLSLVGSGIYGFENKFVGTNVGVRVRLWKGAE